MSDAWIIASAGLTGQPDPSRDIVGAGMQDIATGTEKRDVSEMLDLLALADTPFINKVGWGSESGGTIIEWISEDLNPGYFPILSQIATAGPSIIATQLGVVRGSELTRQVHDGSLLYVKMSGSTVDESDHALLVVTSEPAGISIVVSNLVVGVMSGIASAGAIAGAKVYVLGRSGGQ